LRSADAYRWRGTTGRPDDGRQVFPGLVEAGHALYFAGRFGFDAFGSDAAPETAQPMADDVTAEPMNRRRGATAPARSSLPLALSLSGLGLRLRSP
jgi:hypothetical protein